MSKSPGLQLPTPCKQIPIVSRTALPTPPPSSQPFSHDDALVPDLSDIEITSSPPQTRCVTLSDQSLRKRKHWQVDEDATIVKMVLLRKLFPHRKDINWCAICTELASVSGDCDAYQPGRIRSRFFSTMHGVANAHGISHRDLCQQLAMPFEIGNCKAPCRTPAQVMSDPLPVPHETTAAMRKLNDLAFNAKLREARQALDAHRPDVTAQRRASEGLKSMRSSQIPSSPPARACPTTSGLNERMAAIPILSNPLPPLFHPNSSQPPQSGQPSRSERSQSTNPTSTQMSEAAAQLHANLTAHINPIRKQEWEWSDETRGYIPRSIPTLDQNMWRDSREIYNSAIAYNVKVQKGKKKEKLFVHENPLMSEQVDRKRLSNSAKVQRRARRREGRGFEGVRKRGQKKEKKKGKKRSSSSTEAGSEETNRRMKELHARLEAKALTQK